MGTVNHVDLPDLEVGTLHQVVSPNSAGIPVGEVVVVRSLSTWYAQVVRGAWQPGKTPVSGVHYAHQIPRNALAATVAASPPLMPGAIHSIVEQGTHGLPMGTLVKVVSSGVHGMVNRYTVVKDLTWTPGPEGKQVPGREMRYAYASELSNYAIQLQAPTERERQEAAALEAAVVERAKQELADFKAQVAAVATREAKKRNWCSQIDPILAELGLERVVERETRTYTLTVTVSADGGFPWRSHGRLQNFSALENHFFGSSEPLRQDRHAKIDAVSLTMVEGQAPEAKPQTPAADGPAIVVGRRYWLRNEARRPGEPVFSVDGPLMVTAVGGDLNSRGEAAVKKAQVPPDVLLARPKNLTPVLLPSDIHEGQRYLVLPSPKRADSTVAQVDGGSIVVALLPGVNEDGNARIHLADGPGGRTWLIAPEYLEHVPAVAEPF